MALKAGYVGIKKSMLGVIRGLAGSKIIKTIGDGLSLTNAGKLNVIAATANKLGGIKVGSGLSINDGVLSKDSDSFDYSTTEFATGQKWIDGKDIYGIVLSGDSVPADDATLISGVDFVINAYGAQYVSTKNIWYEFTFDLSTSAQIRWELDAVNHLVKLKFAESNITKYRWVFLYTKYEEEE